MGQHSHISGSIKGFFFEILHPERGQQVYGTYINGFREKNIIWGKCVILSWKWHVIITLDLLQGVVLKFCIMIVAKREVHENCIHDFSKKYILGKWVENGVCDFITLDPF